MLLNTLEDDGASFDALAHEIPEAMADGGKYHRGSELYVRGCPLNVDLALSGEGAT